VEGAKKFIFYAALSFISLPYVKISHRKAISQSEMWGIATFFCLLERSIY